MKREPLQECPPLSTSLHGTWADRRDIPRQLMEAFGFKPFDFVSLFFFTLTVLMVAGFVLRDFIL